MSGVLFRVQRQFFGECFLALRRFIGHMDGVSIVDVENGAVTVEFDERKIQAVQVQQFARDIIEKLGYRAKEV